MVIRFTSPVQFTFIFQMYLMQKKKQIEKQQTITSFFLPSFL